MRCRRLAAAGALAFVVAACSAQVTPVPMPGPVVDKGTVNLTASGATVTQTVQAGDDWFSPTFIKAAPGARVTLTIEDVGDVVHTFTVDSQHVDVVFDKKGQKHTVTVTLPAAGQPLVFYCKYHQSVGMQGALYSH